MTCPQMYCKCKSVAIFGSPERHRRAEVGERSQLEGRIFPGPDGRTTSCTYPRNPLYLQASTRLSLSGGASRGAAAGSTVTFNKQSRLLPASRARPSTQPARGAGHSIDGGASSIVTSDHGSPDAWRSVPTAIGAPGEVSPPAHPVGRARSLEQRGYVSLERINHA